MPLLSDTEILLITVAALLGLAAIALAFAVFRRGVRIAHLQTLLSAREREYAARIAEKDSVVKIGGVLAGVSEQLALLRKSAEAAARENHVLGGAMRDNLGRILSAANTLGAKADKLSVALRGGAHVQGTWGEAVLGTLLSSLGLVEGVHFFPQEGTSSLRPDYQVLDGAGRRLVIDCKTSLTDFLAACELDPRLPSYREQHDALLRKHVESVRRHVRELAEKNYAERLRRAFPDRDYLPLVAMFVPSEGAHSAALSLDPTLVAEALKKDVIIVSPSTLLAYLRLVSMGWQQQRLALNLRQIANETGELLRRLDDGFRHLENAGKSLDKAQRDYDEAMNALQNGRQNVVATAGRIVELGGTISPTSKAMRAAAAGARPGPPEATDQMDAAPEPNPN